MLWTTVSARGSWMQPRIDFHKKVLLNLPSSCRQSQTTKELCYYCRRLVLFLQLDTGSIATSKIKQTFFYLDISMIQLWIWYFSVKQQDIEHFRRLLSKMKVKTQKCFKQIVVEYFSVSFCFYFFSFIRPFFPPHLTSFMSVVLRKKNP